MNETGTTFFTKTLVLKPGMKLTKHEAATCLACGMAVEGKHDRRTNGEWKRLSTLCKFQCTYDYRYPKDSNG